MWERIINQPSFEKIKSHYNENFPLEVRFVCAQWIEDRIKADQFIDINDPQYEQRASNFMHNLIQELEQKKLEFNQPENISIKYRIEEAVRTFTQHIYNPVQVYKQICDALMYEQHVLDNAEVNQQVSYLDNEAVEIVEKLKQLTQLILIDEENCNRLRYELEKYMIFYNEGPKRIQELNNFQSTPEVEQRKAALHEEFNRKLCAMVESINVRRDDLSKSIATIIGILNYVQKVVIHKRLGKWQRDQALAGNGAPLLLNTLDEIQSWFEQLAELIWRTRTLVDTIRKLSVPFQGQSNVNDGFEVAYLDVTNLLQNLIVSGFIVEKQPPQVMKTNTR